MRTLNYISGDADIYQPIEEEDIKYVEKELDCLLPDELKDIYRTPNLNLIKRLPTLLWILHHDTMGILEVNRYLYTRDYDPFPSTIIAFATNECGDFWVINKMDQSIVYIDPDESVAENLLDKELCYRDFSEWLKRYK